MCVSANVGQDVIDAVNAAVADLVGQNKMFSIWDAVTVARRATRQFLGRYNDVKEVVVEAFRNGLMPGYDAQVVSFPDGKGGIAQARVYYPNDGSVDVNSYDPEAIKNDTNQTSTASAPATDPNASTTANPNVAPVSTVSSNDTLETEVKGIGVTTAYRLQIPNGLLNRMGLSVHSKVFLTVPQKGELRISKQAPGRQFEVNQDYRLRLGGKTLKELCPGLSMNGSEKFDVAVILDNNRQERYLRVVRG